MKRWFALLLLLAPCNGCMMLEDMMFVDDAPTWSTAEPPHGTCGQPVRNVSASQTAEPELLQVRK